MAKGGIFDHVSRYMQLRITSVQYLFVNLNAACRGFARYSTDERWHVPHFEKMLYDQAQLTVAYSQAYRATKDKEFAKVIEHILEYTLRDLK